LRATLETHDAASSASASKRKRCEEDDSRIIDKWSRSQPLPLTWRSGQEDLSQDIQPHAGPSSSCVKVVNTAPLLMKFSQELAQRVAASERQQLCDNFNKHHRILQQSDCEKLPDPPGSRKVHICSVAGRCLVHCESGRVLAVAEQKFRDVLKQLFKKDTRPRQLLEKNGLIVFCLESSTGCKHFLHASYLNYVTWISILLPLDESSDPRRRCLSAPFFVCVCVCVCMCVGAACVFLWQVLETMRSERVAKFCRA
jgi:hypothetical protein